MKKLSRREFPGKSAFGIGTAVLASQFPPFLEAAPSFKSKKMPGSGWAPTIIIWNSHRSTGH